MQIHCSFDSSVTVLSISKRYVSPVFLSVLLASDLQLVLAIISYLFIVTGRTQH